MKQIQEMFAVIRTQGIRAAFKKFGWRLVCLVFVYYLVRDLTLYVFIPGMIIYFY